MANTLSKPSLLYVDDEKDNLLVFKSSFRRFYDVHTASSAEEGLKILLDNSIDIVISDQRMPEITGVEFLKSIPEDKTTANMILTGYSDINVLIEALNSGKVHRYLTKPWERGSLKKVIDETNANFSKNRAKTSNKKIETKKSNIKKESDDISSNVNADKDKDAKILELNTQIEEIYTNVKLLSEVGQEIISNLTIEAIIESTYENVNSLMDASVFSIAVYDEETEELQFPCVMEKGKKLPYHTLSIYVQDKPASFCFNNKSEFFTNDFKSDFNKYFKGKPSALAGELPESIIYLPLMIKNKIIGVISVQSFNKNAYTDYHLNVFRNISLFVATAIENAQAYQRIEDQNAEIEKKNVDLEKKVKERTAELERKNLEIKEQHDQVKETYKKVQLLTEIGQQITSTLNLDTILNMIYENVNKLMDATIFGIGFYNNEEKTIHYQLAIEKGKRYQPYTRTMEDKNQFPVWCIENKKEIFVNNAETEYSKYIEEINDVDDVTLEDGSHFEKPLSLIYVPLVFNNEPIGVVTVQSFRKYAYNEYHLDILRSLAAYITTAVQNASSYQKMTEAYEQLKSTQTKLVESEKMASLGQLTAGVAHEINNPVNFISAGINSLKTNYSDLLELLNAYLELKPNNKINEQLERIEQLKEELEINELLDEIDQLFKSIDNGASRTAEIVKGLRNFSRLDEGELKMANIHDCIDSCLVILHNQLKNRIEVVKDYGDIPDINCYPGQLNQVFINMLNNASQAIEGKGTINIKTVIHDDQLQISLKDTGSGMPDEIKDRIFDPFFTTKEVGQGTGLGLSISFGIVEKHKGKIEVKSEKDKGSEFIISLPVG